MNIMKNILILTVIVISLFVIPNHAFSEINSSLHEAAASGNTDKILELINQGKDVNAKDEMRFTPLMVAAQNGQVEAIELLLNKGADIKAKTEIGIFKGYTALIASVSGGHTRAVKILIEKGADVNTKLQGRWSSLVIASVANYKDVVEILLKNGADRTNLEKDIDELKKLQMVGKKTRYEAQLQFLRSELKNAFVAAQAYFLNHPGSIITKPKQLKEAGGTTIPERIIFIKADISETSGSIVMKNMQLNESNSDAAKDLRIGEGMVDFTGELYLPSLK